MPANQLLKTYHRITKDDLRFLLDKNDYEILRKLVQSEFGFFAALEKRVYSENNELELLELVVKLLNQACCVKGQKNAPTLSKLFRMLKDCQEFLFDDIPRVINSCFKKSKEIDLVSFMANYMNILASLLCTDFFPCQRIIDEIFPALENYMNRLREKKIKNLGAAESCFSNLFRKVEQYENPDESDDEDVGITNFRSLSVVPRSNDILNYEIPYIPKNIIDSPYKSVDHFLSVHYRLMREDMLRSFRECVKSCLSSKEQGFSSMNKSNFYKKVCLASDPEYNVDGICYDIKVYSATEIDWSKKNILLPGSLIILSSNLFNTVIFAAVIKNPRVSNSKSKECKLKIKLEDDLFVDRLLDSEYQMIEPAAYFESYKHILSAIKSFRENNFPLSDIIVYLDYKEPEPDYLDGMKYCLHEKCGSAAEHSSTSSCKVFDPLKDEWPIAEDLQLDDQQHVAFKTALTKKVAVIQGPPGTGKTYIGVKVVKALLENLPHKPIVISCLTNHALDQFLERMLIFTKNIVRLGGQSQSKILEPHQMQNLIYAVRQYHEENTLDKSQQKSLDLVKQFASIVLNQKITPEYDVELQNLKILCQEINSNMKSINLCENKYLHDSALNDIIDSKYKEQLRNTPGSIKKTLSSSVLEWLVTSHSSDLYEKCEKKFLIFKSKKILMENNFKNVWDLSETKRFQHFYSWRKKCLDIRKKNLECDIEEYRKLIMKLQSKPVDPVKLEILKGASIIGVTTTGACKFKDLIRFSEPRIIVVEEAAQVLESHVIAALVPSIQHLILIGDHEQLRPLPTNHELSEKYNLKISMFERLFCNGAPSATLVSQHRMKPCIAELLVPRPYANYTSYKNVYEYEEIRGVLSSVFFFDHQMCEDSNSSGNSSSNDFEAQMVVSLATYFYLQSYSLNKITILATYAAQVALIFKYLQEKNLDGIRVTTVDNFQGEENDIILLSFVRSNSTSSIGFLKESNRVCVALSRAKMGMFCFGNFQLFSSKNDFWKQIVENASTKNMIGSSLSLKCNRHQTIQIVKCADDVFKFISNGCSEICNFILPCKHKCAKNCHYNDPDHINYLCQQPCERMIDENRVCPRLCYEKCKRIKKKQIELPCGHFGSGSDIPCLEEIQRCLPCTHFVTLPCYIDIENYKCKAMVKIDLDCGHAKSIMCHENQEEINIICTDLKQQIGACGHYVNVPCSLNLDEKDLLPFCNKACGILLDCGHPCVMLCQFCFGTGIHGFCREKCDLRLPCGHTCDGYCNSPCPPCKKKCFLSCSHYNKCINECLRSCVECDKPCERKCVHNYCSKKCYEKCDVEPCMKPCTKILPCNHRCIGFCGDLCPHLCRICHADDLTTAKAEDSLYIELECEHVIDAKELTEHIDNCLISFEWPSCPECFAVITFSVRYKEALIKAKEISLQSCDTSEDLSEIHYLVESMYGINYIPPAEFLPIHGKIMHILRKTVPRSDSLIVLKNCIIYLKKLAIIKSKIINVADDQIQCKFDNLLLWISYHLTNASFQQLKELESAIKDLEKDTLEYV